MLTKAGAKLLDFGLAKTGTADAPSAGLTTLPTKPPNLTAQGTILGTFQYMAPEQIEGQEADARSDVFAFGVVLYEMVAGTKAFAGKTHASLISSILKEEPRPIVELQPLVPPLLDHIVGRCLAKDPDERWQGASDLTRELRWITRAPHRPGLRHHLSCAAHGATVSSLAPRRRSRASSWVSRGRRSWPGSAAVNPRNGHPKSRACS